MSKYLRLFETTADYTAAESTLVKPNVSLIEETNKVKYNPYIPPIIYTASEKLNRTWSDETATFGTTIKSHTFENGVGTIEFNDNVTKITSTTPYPTDNSAFSYCTNLTSVTIPNTVTNIGNWAFYGCSGLTSINIPDSVTSIGNAAFINCTSLPVENNIRYADTCAVEAVDKTLLTYSLKEGTRFIVNTFQDCTNLTSITIPNSVTTIGIQSFFGCTNLTSIMIPNSVTSIGSQAFYNCQSLTSITIPNSVTIIAEYAFQGCTNLTSIVVESGNTTYDSRDNCNAIIESATNTLITGCKSTVIPNSVTSIGDYAFYDCTNLTSITIPNSVTSIGGRAFFNCRNLTSITVERTTPPTLMEYYGHYDNFDRNVSNRKIYVPSASVNTYKSASGWSTYANDIEAIQQ